MTQDIVNVGGLCKETAACEPLNLPHPGVHVPEGHLGVLMILLFKSLLTAECQLDSRGPRLLETPLPHGHL